MLEYVPRIARIVLLLTVLEYWQRQSLALFTLSVVETRMELRICHAGTRGFTSLVQSN